VVKTRMNRVSTNTGKSGHQRSVVGRRDRDETRKRILTATGRLLARKGSRSLGINAIAREAKVDKVLIYRYFGGLGELYRAFAREGNTFPTLEEMAGSRFAELPSLPPVELAKILILGFVRAIRARPITLEMMRWELQERNELTDEMAKERERQVQQWFALAPDFKGRDMAAVASILVAGQMYLTLRAKTADYYSGIALNTEEGWQRVEEAASLLCDLFFASAKKDSAAGAPTKDRNAGRKKEK
jgi:AcrR family transcriptional regulator